MAQHSSARPVIALLTDFGLRDGYVGVMKGVIATIAPNAHVIDITHEVAPQDVAGGAWILATAYRYLPPGTVFVCVVDPGVGSARAAIALRAGARIFVGPDNGLFHYVLAEQSINGVVALENAAYRLPQVSSTFHGRDIFAPAGAHLARGVALEALGPALTPESLQRLAIRQAERHGAQVEAEVVHIDHFGNLVTNIPLTMLPEFFSAPHMRLLIPKHGITIEQRRRTFAAGAEDGAPFMYGDSSGYIGVAIRNGNAARTLGISVGAPVTLVTAER